MGFFAQNGTEFEVWLGRDTGQRIALLDDLAGLDYVQALSSDGRWIVTIAGEVDPALLSRDRRIVIYRKPAGGAMRRDFAGLLTWWRYSDGGGKTTTTLAGPGLNALLRGRIVAYAAGTPQASKTGPIDDLMKAILRENFGSLATDTDRALSSAYFRVDPDFGLGPSIDKSFAWRRVSDVLADLSEAARQNGTELYYALEHDDEAAMTFRVFPGQLGRDRDLTLSVDDETLLNPSLTVSYDDEINTAYGGGQGEGSERTIETASDPERIAGDLFGRREGFADARNEASASGVTAAAQALVSAGRPVIRFAAEIGNRPGAQYGIDWVFGDRLKAFYRRRTWACLVRAVRVQMAAGADETVSARLEAVA